MNTNFSKNLTGKTIANKIRRFYDVGSPYYYMIYGEHIHDGYYITGKESKEEAQENLVKFLAEKANIKRGARVLDVGCGVGGSSIWLAEKLGAVTTGITISPVQVKIATQLAKKEQVNSSFHLMNAEEMQFTAPFDVIWVVGVMTHLVNQEKFLESASGYLNHGGKLVIFDWMTDESVIEPKDDRYIRPVAKGMLLSSLYPLSKYVEWFKKDGYQIDYTEDITGKCIKTWDDALTVIRNPVVWKLAGKASIEEIKEVFKFIKSVSAMKLAMRKRKLICGAIVAQKM
jgi:tocopherol O-methyltransferase